MKLMKSHLCPFPTPFTISARLCTYRAVLASVTAEKVFKIATHGLLRLGKLVRLVLKAFKKLQQHRSISRLFTTSARFFLDKALKSGLIDYNPTEYFNFRSFPPSFTPLPGQFRKGNCTIFIPVPFLFLRNIPLTPISNFPAPGIAGD